MVKYILISMILLSIISLTTALPVFDAELAANPFVHEKRLNYRGGRLNLLQEKNNSQEHQ